MNIQIMMMNFFAYIEESSIEIYKDPNQGDNYE